MRSIDPENSETALGLRRIDIRTAWRSVIETTQPERELRLAIAYWLNTIQPYIAGRRLRGAEWYIAMDQHSHLRGNAKFAESWNETKEGGNCPVPPEVFPDWSKAEFQEPEQLLADASLKPEILAGIAANLMNARQKVKTPIEAVQDAHELLLAAERHIGTLPRKPQSRDPVKHFEEVLKPHYEKVTFDEILQSNEANSGRMPLLPPVQKMRNDGRLTLNALKTAVRRFLQQHTPSITKEEFEREEKEMAVNLQKDNEDYEKGIHKSKMFHVGSGKTLSYAEWLKLNQDSINDILENQRISAHLLATMRWERFYNHWKNQKSRTQKRMPGYNQAGKTAPKQRP